MDCYITDDQLAEMVPIVNPPLTLTGIDYWPAVIQRLIREEKKAAESKKPGYTGSHAGRGESNVQWYDEDKVGWYDDAPATFRRRDYATSSRHDEVYSRRHDHHYASDHDEALAKAYYSRIRIHSLEFCKHARDAQWADTDIVAELGLYIENLTKNSGRDLGRCSPPQWYTRVKYIVRRNLDGDLARVIRLLKQGDSRRGVYVDNGRVRTSSSRAGYESEHDRVACITPGSKYFDTA
jgi:hypothetical protein